jgi:probable rRNA maturation factor
MNLRVDIQNASSSAGLPPPAALKRWVRAALDGRRASAELSLRIVDEQEITELNGRYRGKHVPTNVLSFPAGLPAGLALPHLGDIVICAPVVAREADEQHKPPHAHWAHMVVHGTLHLLGHDHIEDAEATVMEDLEIAILARLHVANPYQTG